jgi:Tfp pilus assembly protein PilF
MYLFNRASVVSSVASIASVAFVVMALQVGPAFAADTFTTPEPASQPTRTSGNKERITVAREAIKAKDFKKSIAELTLAVQEHPGNAELHNLLGYSYRKQATPDLPRAFEQYRLALKFDSEHRGANEYIGEAYLMDKKPAKAEEHLAKLKSICGNTTCEEYQDLAKSIADYKAKNK